MSTQTLYVPHLGGIDVGYRLSQPAINRTKPTIVLFNPFTATTDYYEPEFQNTTLVEAANLVAVEPLGHGHTIPRSGAILLLLTGTLLTWPCSCSTLWEWISSLPSAPYKAVGLLSVSLY